MQLSDYQAKAGTFMIKNDDPAIDTPLMKSTILALGIAGEAGEVADKWKKILAYHKGAVNEEDKAELAKEIGDTLWYLATFAESIGLSLDDIAQQNLAKLADRKQRDVVRGTGDNR